VIHRYFVVCLVGVWQRNFEPVVCVCTVRPALLRPLHKMQGSVKQLPAYNSMLVSRRSNGTSVSTLVSLARYSEIDSHFLDNVKTHVLGYQDKVRE
jgi:hypothetical protein